MYHCTKCQRGITEQDAKERDGQCPACSEEPATFRVEGDGWDDDPKLTKAQAEKVVLHFALNELEAEDIHVYHDGGEADADEWDVILTVEIVERG